MSGPSSTKALAARSAVFAGAALAVRQTITAYREDQRGADYETEKLCGHKEPSPRPDRQFSGAFGLVDPRKERDRRLDAIAGLEARAKRRLRRGFIDAEQFK